MLWICAWTLKMQNIIITEWAEFYLDDDNEGRFYFLLLIN